MKKNWTSYLYLFTILFFTIGLFNIIFAWLGFICMILPFILLLKDRKKTWCQKYCPRASLYTVLFQGRSKSGKASPKWLTKGNAKIIMLIYFSVNLFILIMSTFMVFMGRIDAVDRIRFMFVFQLPWEIPQALSIWFIPDWAIHLSFRIYSMMFTTTTIGLILGWLYKPRIWCTICPINTLSDMSLKK